MLGSARMGRIFITDDDVDMRELLQGALERAGHETELAENGDELLRKLREARHFGGTPDLVISDIRMPGTCGLGTLGFIRRELPGLPVILITAFGDPETHRRARQLGAVAVLDKPFPLDDLHQAIERTLQLGDSRHAL